MKKKVLIGLIILAVGLVLVGVIVLVSNNKTTNKKKTETRTVESNGVFDKYTGIYESGNVKVKMVHFGDKVLIKMDKAGKDYGYSVGLISENITRELNCTFKFNDDSINVTSEVEGIPNGKYSKDSKYDVNSIYKDFIGDLKYLKNELNGEYVSGQNIIYISFKDDDTLMFNSYNNDTLVNTALSKTGDKSYSTELDGNKYEVVFNEDKFTLNVESGNESIKSLAGEYSKKHSLNAEEVIKIFSFNL